MSDRLEQLTKLYAAEPQDPFLTYGIALEHAKAQRLDKAIMWLDKTLGLDDSYCYAYFQKGKMLSEKGEEAAAQAVLKQGIEAAKACGDEKAENELGELLTNL